MLSKYDEYPVHQSAHPFSRIPSTDLSWDQGYYFGVFNAEQQVFLLSPAYASTAMRTWSAATR
jgi:hypothetical protein